MDIALGKEVVNVGREYVNKNIDKINFQKLHRYFNISNAYVLRKLLLIVVPFKNRDWNVVLQRTGNIAHPDLYIPIMSFATYILFKGLALGMKNTFKPERLGLIATRSLFLEFLFVSVAKLAAYLIDISELSTLDMLAFSGYKYFVIVLMFLLRIRLVSFFLKIYLCLAFFFFLSRSMKGLVFGSSFGNKKRKVYFLFVAVFMQILIVTLHCYFF